MTESKDGGEASARVEDREGVNEACGVERKTHEEREKWWGGKPTSSSSSYCPLPPSPVPCRARCTAVKMSFGERTTPLAGDPSAGASYDLLQRNCNHFCEDFAAALGCERPPPGWVNRLARTGDSINGALAAAAAHPLSVQARASE